MKPSWNRSEALAATRAVFLKEGAVTNGFRGVCVTAAGEGVLVVFQWARDPNTYAFCFPLPGEPGEVSFAGRFDSPEDWARDIAMWLMEELDTALVNRAARSVRYGVVHLTWPPPSSRRRDGHCIGGVPLQVSSPDQPTGARLHRQSAAVEEKYASVDKSLPGWRLAASGLDVGRARRALEERRLVCWLEAYVDNSLGDPVVGHAVATWSDEDPATASIEVVEVVSGTPASIADELALSCFLSSRASGALRVVTVVRGPAWPELGFHRAAAGGFERRARDAEATLS